MTAEIAVMNKMAVALAADSAVTVARQTNERKIYNTVNKLFSLSKYHPVGIMIYGNAELLGVPWESIIKIFRKKLGDTCLPTLGDYGQKFIAFLDEKNSLFPEIVQDRNFQDVISEVLFGIKIEINKSVNNHIARQGSITDSQIAAVVDDEIDSAHNHLERQQNLSHLPSEYHQNILEKCRQIVSEEVKQIFQALPVSEETSEKLILLLSYLFYKDVFPNGVSGIVIAGFGEEEVFPSLVNYSVDMVVNNRLKYKEEKSVSVDDEKTAMIFPFAQGEMVDAFMEGIDPFYRHTLDSYLKEIFTQYPDIILQNLPIAADEKQKQISTLKKDGLDLLRAFQEKMRLYRHEQHIDPILEAVAVLPKDEIAAMAETLVNLTSFKRRVSMQAETVGGPTDVAVISKGDGLVWIKRKHYFNAALNPQFTTNYFRQDSNSKKDDNADNDNL